MAKLSSGLLMHKVMSLKYEMLTLSAQGNADDYQLSLQANSQLGAYPAVDLNTQLKGSLTKATLTSAKHKSERKQCNYTSQC